MVRESLAKGLAALSSNVADGFSMFGICEVCGRYQYQILYEISSEGAASNLKVYDRKGLCRPRA